MDLKLILEQLDVNDRQVDLDHLINNMLQQIGSTDPVLRDDLIYSTFSKLVMMDFLNKEQLTHLLNVCLDQEHLFYQIGERETDSVFTRSFSVLVVALVVEKDRSSRFLKKEQIEASIEGIIRYLQAEQDTRGFVALKGWAHSIAHGADALAELIRHPFFDREKTVECLDAIQECLFKEGTYVDDEDERLLFAIEALLEKGMKEERLSNWVTSLSDNLESLFEVERYSVAFFHKKGNVLSFLKSCYFRLLIRDTCSDARSVIEDVVEKWTRKIYLGD
ncbi:DUF2785 domain-containing protein [Guptibacillus hwajinpoensis]|uniref:DUF2785 domain-containing protein n=1 Tax=Guptibacillus hwajinpoensis TaxID=208199 RepID=UPI0024B3B1F1|nr:DUF2785 domain-containing protein [Pseudalkalibacillus hwajinpoensis]